jgi:hypothetical protein
VQLRTNKTAHTIKRDIPCVVCGYNLRTLAENAVCPECGEDVDVSLRQWHLKRNLTPRPLEESDPQWLKQLAIGASVMLLAIVLIILLMFPMAVVNFQAAVFPIWIIAMVGHWLMTTPETPAVRERYNKLFIACYSVWPLVCWVLLHRETTTLLILCSLAIFAIAVSFACQHYLVLIMVADRWHPLASLFCMGLMILYLVYFGVGVFDSLKLFSPGSQPLAGLLSAMPTLGLGSAGLPAELVEHGEGALSLTMMLIFFATAAVHIFACARLWQAYFAAEATSESGVPTSAVDQARDSAGSAREK